MNAKRRQILDSMVKGSRYSISPERAMAVIDRADARYWVGEGWKLRLALRGSVVGRWVYKLVCPCCGHQYKTNQRHYQLRHKWQHQLAGEWPVAEGGAR